LGWSENGQTKKGNTAPKWQLQVLEHDDQPVDLVGPCFQTNPVIILYLSVSPNSQARVKGEFFGMRLPGSI